MNKFDSLFFGQYISSEDKIERVFHRHFFVIVEDIILWSFFGFVIPIFLYGQDAFGLQATLAWGYVWLYMLVIYAVLMYKVFDWYADVWVATDSTIIAVKWKWFTSNILYIPYGKIEGIEVRTHSWVAALFRMSDVVVKLAWQEEFILSSARNPGEITEYLQWVAKWKHGGKDEDKEPFDILVDALSDVVKWHLTTQWKTYITRDYVEKLDTTLTHGKAIDLRTKDEKIIIENWKWKYTKSEESEEHEEGSNHSGTHH
jgi:hypothetical protein